MRHDRNAPLNCTHPSCEVHVLGEHPSHEEDFEPERECFGDPLDLMELYARQKDRQPQRDPVKQRKHDHRLDSYRRLKADLIAQLGGCCATCGSEENLCFDHIYNDRTWSVRQAARWTRIARYKREAEERRIQLLCNSCNVRKENHRRGQVANRERSLRRYQMGS